MNFYSKNQIPFLHLSQSPDKYVSVNLKSLNKKHFFVKQGICKRMSYDCFPFEISKYLRCYLMQNCSQSSFYSFSLKFEALSAMKLMQKCSNWKYSNDLITSAIFLGFILMFLGPPPEALGRDQKVKYHVISVTKSISKIFMC